MRGTIMADVSRYDLPEASEQEKRRADIGDRLNAEVDESERGQNFAPRRGEDVRDNVPGRYAAQGNSKWGRGEPGADAVRKAAEEELREQASKRAEEKAGDTRK
ncbi:MAG: hypothetical protein L0Y64_23625 [Myxococcaceae bacterium]|nr:hypothetical protein [Myxococcaceae bacterium]